LAKKPKKKKVWRPFEDVTLAWRAGMPTVEETMFSNGVSREHAEKQVEDLRKAKVYNNGEFEVNITDDPGSFLHVSVKRLDRAPIRDWRVMQRIKNELVGPEHEGLELYPAESRVVDMANQYHMWVLKNEGERVPCGWSHRLANDGDNLSGRGKQRPIGDDGYESE